MFSNFPGLFIFLCVFLLGCTAQEAPPEEPALQDQHWEIQEGAIPAFLREGQKLKILDRLGIQTSFVEGGAEKPDAVFDPIYFSQSTREILTYKGVGVYALSPGFEKLHIGISAESLLTNDAEKLETFRTVFQAVGRAYQALGYRDYYAFVDFQKISDEKVPLFEMIPEGYQDSKTGQEVREVNIRRKLQRTLYGLFGYLPERFRKPQNPALQESFHIELLKELRQPRQRTISPGQDCFIRPAIKNQEVLDMLGFLKEKLQKAGALKVFRKKSPSQEKSHGEQLAKRPEDAEFSRAELKFDSGNCAFCRPEVIQNQKTCEKEGVVVLYNFAPYSQEKHFMVIPRAHIPNIQDVSKEMWEHFHKLALAATQGLSEKTPQGHVIWFVQNGVSAGQTVPHTHLHVLIRPNPLVFAYRLVQHLDGNRESLESIDRVNNQYRGLFQKYLSKMENIP